MEMLRDRGGEDGDGVFNANLWAGAADGEPITYPSRCWVCQADVFAHSNGFGDFVLLDPPLGPPWHVHDCYASRHMKGRKLVEVIREGLLPLCDSVGSQTSTSLCGVVLARLPSPTMPHLDALDILIGGRRRLVEIDYWRIGPQGGSAVWVFRATEGAAVVIPVEWEKPRAAESALTAIAVGDRQARLATVTDDPRIRGTVVGVERAPGYLLKDFTSVPEIVFYGEKPRLLWLLSNNDRLVPVIARKWFTNQRVGTHWWASGKWDRAGQLTVLVVERLL